MKETIKAFVKNLPLVGSTLQRLADRRRKNDLRQWDKAITARLAKKKANGEPIHVVFVCHRPAVWESLHSVYDAMKENPAFRVTLVTIPNKKQLPELGLRHQQYESEGAEEFWQEEGTVSGYDYASGQWLELQTLEPDYVFFQQPYNACRPPQYHSSVVSQYARICYVSYFGVFYIDEIYDECAPLDYLRDLSFFFTQNPMDDAYIRSRVARAGGVVCRVCNTGFPRYDRIEQYRDQGSFV